MRIMPRVCLNIIGISGNHNERFEIYGLSKNLTFNIFNLKFEIINLQPTILLKESLS